MKLPCKNTTEDWFKEWIKIGRSVMLCCWIVVSALRKYVVGVREFIYWSYTIMRAKVKLWISKVNFWKPWVESKQKWTKRKMTTNKMIWFKRLNEVFLR